MSTAAPAAPAASPGYLSATPATPAATPAPAAPAAAPATPAAPNAAPTAGTGFFRDDFAKDGKFAEGWSAKFGEMGLSRLAAKGAMAKDEASFFKMLDDTIGHASGKKITRPVEGDNDQTVSDFRTLVGAPPKAENYEFKPAKLPKDYAWDEDMGNRVAQLAHKHHVPAEFLKELGPEYVAWVERQSQAGKDKFESRIGELAAQSEAHFKKEWGEDHDGRRQANLDFINARQFDLTDPAIRMALSHPMIVQLVDEARRATREAPLPGVPNEVFQGSGSPRQQAKAIMEADPKWRSNPEKAKRVNDLYALEAQQRNRGGKR